MHGKSKETRLQYWLVEFNTIDLGVVLIFNDVGGHVIEWGVVILIFNPDGENTVGPEN